MAHRFINRSRHFWRARPKNVKTREAKPTFLVIFINHFLKMTNRPFGRLPSEDRFPPNSKTWSFWIGLCQKRARARQFKHTPDVMCTSNLENFHLFKKCSRARSFLATKFSSFPRNQTLCCSLFTLTNEQNLIWRGKTRTQKWRKMAKIFSFLTIFGDL